MITLESLKLNFTVEAHQTFENLTIYPVIKDKDIDLDYLTLDEGFRDGVVEIKEIDGGRVSELLVINRSPKDLLIISGEELIGALQNRAINATILVPAKSSLNIPVSCTESGRWRSSRYGIRMGMTAHHFSSPDLRSVISSSVIHSVKHRRRYHSNQQGVWNSIDNFMRSLDITSDTSAQSDIFEKMKNTVDSYLKYFCIIPGQSGLIGLINGRIISFELFGKSDTFSKMFDKILRSFIIDAISKTKESYQINEDITEFLDDIKKATIENYEALGKGEHKIIETVKHRGMALFVDDKIVHLLLNNKIN